MRQIFWNFKYSKISILFLRFYTFSITFGKTSYEYIHLMNKDYKYLVIKIFTNYWLYIFYFIM